MRRDFKGAEGYAGGAIYVAGGTRAPRKCSCRIVAGIGLMTGGARKKMEDARHKSNAKMLVSSEDSQASCPLTAVEKPKIT